MNNIIEKIKLLINNSGGQDTYSIKISSKNKIIFLEQLSNLLNSGIPLMNGLKIMMYQTRDNKIKEFIKNIINLLNKGSNLKQAFSQYPKIFGVFDLSIIQMGEVTGKLGDSIETIKIKEEKSKELKGKIIGALIYPMVIIVLSMGMILVFMIYVIPRITSMYKDAKVNLPELTNNVIKISDFLQDNIFLLILGIIIFIISFSIFKSHKKTKIYYDTFILKIPIFGSLIKKKILSLFTSSLGTLLENGVIINESLKISSKALENKYYEKELNKIISGVSKGLELSELMGINEIKSGKENNYFPIELASIIKIGEETGNLPKLLLRISGKYNKDIDEIVKNMQTAIEPIVIVGVGGIIGTLIMAIMLPFFNMVNVI